LPQLASQVRVSTAPISRTASIPPLPQPPMNLRATNLSVPPPPHRRSAAQPAEGTPTPELFSRTGPSTTLAGPLKTRLPAPAAMPQPAVVATAAPVAGDPAAVDTTKTANVAVATPEMKPEIASPVVAKAAAPSAAAPAILDHAQPDAAPVPTPVAANLVDIRFDSSP